MKCDDRRDGTGLTGGGRGVVGVSLCSVRVGGAAEVRGPDCSTGDAGRCRAITCGLDFKKGGNAYGWKKVAVISKDQLMV